jgi:hypothetical protein
MTAPIQPNTLQGHRVVMTGKCFGMDRTVAQRCIELAGANNGAKVDAGTTLVVCKDWGTARQPKPTAKVNDALARNIPIVNDLALLAVMLGQGALGPLLARAAGRATKTVQPIPATPPPTAPKHSGPAFVGEYESPFKLGF